MDDDTKIIQSIKSGDDNALALLIKRYNGFVHYRAMQFFPDKDERDDVVQQAWIIAWQKIPCIEIKNFLAWMGEVTKNAALKKIEYENRACRKHISLEQYVDTCSFYGREAFGEENNIEQYIDDKYTISQIMGIVDGFKPPARDRMKAYLSGEKEKDSVKRFGGNRSAFSVSIYKNKKKIVRELEKCQKNLH